MKIFTSLMVLGILGLYLSLIFCISPLKYANNNSGNNNELFFDNDQNSDFNANESVNTADSQKNSDPLEQLEDTEETTFDLTAYLKLKDIMNSENYQKDIHPRLPTSPSAYNLNDQRQFSAYNFSTDESYLLTATLKAIAAHCMIWVDNASLSYVSQADADYLALIFATKIYPTDTAYFGYPEDVNSDGINISIILTELGTYGVAGYFSSEDQISNNIECFYVDHTAGTNDKGLEGTMAHEFQHMIHNANDNAEERWIDEGCAVFAEYLNEYLLASREWTIPYFEADPDTSLIYWDYNSENHPVYINYAMGYLFMYYLSEYYGGSSSIANFAQNGIYHGIEGIQKLILDNYSISFDKVFADWVIANYLDDPSFNNYGYTNIEMFTAPQREITLTPGSPSDTISDTVDYRAGQAYKLQGFDGTVTIDFDGQAGTNFDVIVVGYNRVSNTVTNMTLDTNQNGSLVVPMYNDVYIFVINQQGTQGGFWWNFPTTNSSFILDITYTTSVDITNEQVSVNNTAHTISITGVHITNQSTTWTTAGLVGVEIVDSNNNPTDISTTLNYNTGNSAWEVHDINIHYLPTGSYICQIFCKLGTEGGTINSIPFSRTDATDVWTVWISDPINSYPSEIELLNLSYCKTATHFLLKIGLESAPVLDNNHSYVVYFDLNYDGDEEWQAFWGYWYGMPKTMWYHISDGWYAPKVHYIEGNNLIYKLPLREFADINIMNVYCVAELVNASQSDSSPYTPASLYYKALSKTTITSNSQFSSAGFSGSGISSSPYVLDNVAIGVNGSYIALNITNTNAYFQINGSYFNGKHGIYLTNVQNGVISHSRFEDNAASGVVISGCQNINFTDNSILNNGAQGVWIGDSSHDLQLSNNTCMHNAYSGICASVNTNNNEFYNNTLQSNSQNGIYLYTTENNVLRNNRIQNNGGHGISLYASNKTIIDENNCTQNTENGLYLFSSNGNNMTQNVFNTSLSYHGIVISNGSSSNIIFNNSLGANSYYGVYLYFANLNTVINNTFIGNNGGGIQACDSGSTGNLFNFNYYDEWALSHSDGNGDGIIDQAYPIAGDVFNTDSHPLAKNPHVLSEFGHMTAVLLMILFFGIIIVKKTNQAINHKI